MKRKAPKTPQGVKPLYVVRLNEKRQGADDGAHLGYYAANSAWKPIPKEQADKMNHKRARALQGYAKRLGYSTTIEPA